MFRSPVLIITLAFTVHASAYGPEFRWEPVEVTGATHTIDSQRGNPGVPSEVTIESPLTGPLTVKLEVDISGWGDAVGSPNMSSYQATIDTWSGFVSGPGEPLGYLGGVTAPESGYLDISHPRFVMRNVIAPCEVLWFFTLRFDANYEMGADVLGGCSIPDPGTIEYGGTVVLEIPSGAYGTYTIPFYPYWYTHIRDAGGAIIEPITKTPALITIPMGRCCHNVGPFTTQCHDELGEIGCASLPAPRVFTVGATCDDSPCWFCLYGQPGADAMCDDFNVCTDDACSSSMICEHTPRYDPAAECCDPTSGDTTWIDDGNDCTEDVCNEINGAVTHTNLTGTACEHSKSCVINDYCDAGVCVGNVPEDLSIPCTTHDDCPGGWFCEPATGHCDCARKNRYLSFSAAGANVAYQVTMTESTFFPESTGVVGWVGPPFDATCVDDQGDPLPGDPVCRGDFVSRLVDQPFFSDAWPILLDVADCPIVPAAVYEIRPTADGIVFGDPIVVPTIAKPDKWWADIVGMKVSGDWTAPEGVVNFDDIQASIQKFEHKLGPPHLTWVDVDGEVPNAVINLTDVQLIILAFEGAQYPFSDPATCP